MQDLHQEILYFFDALQYPYLQRAFLAGAFVSVCCSVLGVFLVLRRMSMIGHGLAHVAFGTVGFAMAVGWSPLYVSIPLVMIASLGMSSLAEKAQLQGDAPIGLVSGLGLAVGVICARLGGGTNIDLFSYLFGDISAVGGGELWISVLLSVAILIAIVLFYHDLVAVTFSPESAQVQGIPSRWIERVLVVCTAVTVVLGMKVVGAMLVASLVVFPAATALQLGRGFRMTVVLAAVVGVVSVMLGIFVAFIWDLPTGAAIVVINAGFFAPAYLYSAVTK